MTEILNSFGPLYPALGAAVAKFRRIESPTWEQKQAHGEAVEKAIRALQRTELQRELPSFQPRCASGTWHNAADGKVGEAVRAQNNARLLTHPGKVRRERADITWRIMYEDAMDEKRRRKAAHASPTPEATS